MSAARWRRAIARAEPVIAGRPVRLRLELTTPDPFPVQVTNEDTYWDLDGDRKTNRHLNRLIFDWAPPMELEHRFPRPGRVRVGVEFTAAGDRDADALFIDVQPPPAIESAPTPPAPALSPPGNQAPMATFLAPAEVPVNKSFALDATGSSDADGRIVRYRCRIAARR